MIELNIKNFEEEISKNDIILVDFWAEWCGPCKMMEPTLVKLEQYIRIGKVEIDKNTALATKYSIKGVPTLIIFNNGAVVRHYTGVRTYTSIKEFIDSLNPPKIV